MRWKLMRNKEGPDDVMSSSLDGSKAKVEALEVCDSKRHERQPRARRR